MFGERIKELRKRYKMTQKQLAEKLFIDQTAVSYWESGKTKPDFEKQQLLADLFNVSVDYLLGRDTVQTNRQKGIMVPVLGKVVAGIPLDAVEEILDYEEISKDMAKQGDHFALQIKGNSMEPKFSEGDVVIVRKQPDVDTGDIAVVLVNGNEATVKKIKKRHDGVMLVPTNLEYEVMFYNNAEIQSLPVTILGKVVELRAKF